jgi:hypothetical protein
LIGGNCPSTDKVVENAQTRLTDIIKNVVTAEMNKYNVPLQEGFQTSQERDLATVVVSSVRDKVTTTVRNSIEAAGYTAAA